MKKIVVNGRALETDRGTLSYADLCALGGCDPIRNPSMTYRTREGVGGTLAHGDRIGIADGLVVNVFETGNA